VSLLWRDEVSIYLAPTRIALARRPRGRGAVVGATDVRPTGASSADARVTLETLAALLQEPGWQQADARVIVADAWVRYALVPWSGGGLDDEERTGQARFALVDAFGDALDGWRVALAEPELGRPSLACAVRPDLVSGLEGLLQGAGLKLRSLRPQLVASYNAWRRALPDSAWFVSLDEGSLAAVHLSGGRWDRVHTARIGSDWTTELRRLQAFGRLVRAAGAVEPMYVDAPGWLRPQGEVPAGIEWLDESQAVPGLRHELALLQRAYA
jgi:hypothetical protein